MKINNTLLVASSGWINRIIAAIVQIISIPLFIKTIGLNGYAAFSVAAGFMCWFLLADFGIGSTLQNEISLCRANNQNTNEIIHTYLSLLIYITILAIMIYLPVSVLLNHLLVKTFVAYPKLLFISGFFYILLVNANSIYKVLFANHKGYLVYLSQSVANVVWFIIILFLYFINMKINPEILLFIVVSPQILVSLILFKFLNMPWKQIFCFPSNNKIKLYISILRKSKRFFWILLSSNFVLGVDYFFIAKLLNQNDIITYNIINKVYAFIVFGYSVFLSAMWPVLSELYAKTTKDNLKKSNLILFKYISSSIIYVVIASLVLILLKSYVIKILAKSSVNISFQIIVLFCIYYCIRVFVDFICVALQSRNQIKILMITAPLQGIITVFLMLMSVREFGLLGIMYALIGGFILTAFWMLPMAYIRENKRLLCQM